MVPPLVRAAARPGATRERAEALAAKTYELTSYLVDELGVVDVGARVDATVTVHDACHGLRNLGVRDAPRRLLEAAGATLVEMTSPRRAAASAARSRSSTARSRRRSPTTSSATRRLPARDWLVSGDVACLAAPRRAGAGGPAIGPEPVHVAELLAAGLPAADR